MGTLIMDPYWIWSPYVYQMLLLSPTHYPKPASVTYVLMSPNRKSNFLSSMCQMFVLIFVCWTMGTISQAGYLTQDLASWPYDPKQVQLLQTTYSHNVLALSNILACIGGSWSPTRNNTQTIIFLTHKGGPHKICLITWDYLQIIACYKTQD